MKKRLYLKKGWEYFLTLLTTFEIFLLLSVDESIVGVLPLYLICVAGVYMQYLFLKKYARGIVFIPDDE